MQQAVALVKIDGAAAEQDARAKRCLVRYSGVLHHEVAACRGPAACSAVWCRALRMVDGVRLTAPRQVIKCC